MSRDRHEGWSMLVTNVTAEAATKELDAFYEQKVCF
jgi:hypothetical protein